NARSRPVDLFFLPHITVPFSSAVCIYQLTISKYIEDLAILYVIVECNREGEKNYQEEKYLMGRLEDEIHGIDLIPLSLRSNSLKRIETMDFCLRFYTVQKYRKRSITVNKI
ncbi:hypothetical protein L9F63_012656, partial [Diploptera punctata]